MNSVTNQKDITVQIIIIKTSALFLRSVMQLITWWGNIKSVAGLDQVQLRNRKYLDNYCNDMADQWNPSLFDLSSRE